MQVYLPLNSEATFAQTKAFSKAVAELLAREEPGLVVARQTKSARAGKVLVDWGQNDVNKTTVNVYSLRAMARPTVSTPVTWDEVRAAQAPEDLTFEARRRPAPRRRARRPLRAGAHACPAPARGVACAAMALLRRLIAALRISPEERQAECAERCLELLCDPERASAARLGEHEEAAIEAVAAPLGGRAAARVADVAQSSRTSGTKRTSSSSSRSRPGRRAPGERQALQRLGDRRDEPPAGRELGLELGQRPRRCRRPRR